DCGVGELRRDPAHAGDRRAGQPARAARDLRPGALGLRARDAVLSAYPPDPAAVDRRRRRGRAEDADPDPQRNPALASPALATALAADAPRDGSVMRAAVSCSTHAVDRSSPPSSACSAQFLP